ncbi:MAG TPA: FkbM family methyltransferase [Candidatus Obscuribacterales bacterium]
MIKIKTMLQMAKDQARAFPLLKKIVRRSRRYRRRLFEFLNNDRYSRPALDIEQQLEQYLPSQGFFIEVGGNDGFSQSNTYYLESIKGWRGILIEPIPELYRECVQERPNSKVYNCALVSANYSEAFVTMKYGDLMSLVDDAFDSREAQAKHLATASNYYKIKPYEVQVPARTLTSILDELNVKQIDLFSLDVEGYELNVLQGLDFDKYQPHYILIECLDQKAKQTIEAYLSNFYTCIAKLSSRDYLYQYSKIK